MAVHRPLVFSANRVRRLPAGDSIEGAGTGTVIEMTNRHGSTVVIGQAVMSSSGDDSFSLAQGNDLAYARVIGLVADTSIANLADGGVQVAGELEATTAEWDAVTGDTGGLSASMAYYLSTSTAGRITTDTATTEDEADVFIGVALSPTRLLLAIAEPVIL